MAGTKTTLKDLRDKVQELKKSLDRDDLITELRKAFIRQGFSPWMAEQLAIEKYKTIHR